MLRARGTGTPPNESKEGENAKAILAPRASLAHPLAHPTVEGSHMRCQGPGFLARVAWDGLGPRAPQRPQPSLRPKPKVAKPICCWAVFRQSKLLMRCGRALAEVQHWVWKRCEHELAG